MSLDYDNYIREHRENVKHALEWMRDNLLLSGDAITEALADIDNHDESKYSKEEYDAYDAYFYGHNRSFSVVQDFNKAWLHHIHCNPHHWQHWVLINDDSKLGMTALEMPEKYIYEMIADWWSFSWRAGNLLEIFSWYDKCDEYIMLNQRTRLIVEDILDRMLAILNMQMVRERPSYREEFENTTLAHSDEKDKSEKYGVPELKKFPMPDADHVRSAIRFFNYVDPKYEQELADAILERMEEYGMSFDDFGVGDENRFKKYIPKEEAAEDSTNND